MYTLQCTVNDLEQQYVSHLTVQSSVVLNAVKCTKCTKGYKNAGFKRSSKDHKLELDKNLNNNLVSD